MVGRCRHVDELLLEQVVPAWDVDSGMGRLEEDLVVRQVEDMARTDKAAAIVVEVDDVRSSAEDSKLVADLELASVPENVVADVGSMMLQQVLLDSSRLRAPELYVPFVAIELSAPPVQLSLLRQAMVRCLVVSVLDRAVVALMVELLGVPRPYSVLLSWLLIFSSSSSGPK